MTNFFESKIERTSQKKFRDLGLVCSNEMLELHILPTEKCNFRCLYCYESFEQGRMTNEVVESVKNLLKNRAPDLKVLNISWFGGEPLTALSIVEDISAYAQALASQYGFDFRGVMTTNAWHLTPAVFKKLVYLGVRNYQITLDGPALIHNQVRLQASGAGSFDVIWQHLQAAKATSLDFEIMIRLHIRPDTLKAIADWLPTLKSELLADPRFTVLVKPVEKLGGANDSLINTFEDDRDRHAASQIIYDLIGNTKAVREDIFGRACYAARPNSWVIRANGDLARCTVALESENNRVGRLLKDGHMELDQAKLTPWFKGLQDMSTDILACPAKYL
jgi:uncharacterized protein